MNPVGYLWLALALAMCAAVGWGGYERKRAHDAAANLRSATATCTGVNMQANGVVESLRRQLAQCHYDRAVDRVRTDAALEDSRRQAETRGQELADAQRRVRDISRTPDCEAVMSAPICPDIESELRR